MIPDEEVRLTNLTHTAGCAAKIGSGSSSKFFVNLG